MVKFLVILYSGSHKHSVDEMLSMTVVIQNTGNPMRPQISEVTVTGENVLVPLIIHTYFTDIKDKSYSNEMDELLD